MSEIAASDRLPPSIATRIARLPPDERRRILESLGDDVALFDSWCIWARPDQLAPAGDWDVWTLLGGRGAGKTRSAAEWACAMAEAGTYRQGAIVAPTDEAVRKVCVEGVSGILACARADFRPTYESSLSRVVWPNGCVCNLFSGEEPQRLRGYNCDFAWVDELCAINSQDTARSMWDMLSMCVRIPGPKGDHPRITISTTPKNWRLLIEIINQPTTVTTKTRTIDNIENLSPRVVATLINRYGGTTLGRQELDAEILADLEGAMWQRSLIDQTRVPAIPASLRRIVVGVDPAGGGPGETGIIVAGIDTQSPPHGYILADWSIKASPQRWARQVIEAYRTYRADRVVVEKNYGGEMAESTIRQCIDGGQSLPVKMVQASRGKQLRAEPVCALYEQGRVHHVGVLPALEDQMAMWDPDAGGPSPDRIDALVWCVTELLCETTDVIDIWLRCGGFR